MRARHSFAVFSLLLGLATLGCGGGSGSGTPIEVSAADLFAAYDSDAEAAGSKYTNHTVLVTGKVKSISTDGDTPFILLDPETEGLLDAVQCTFPVDSKDKLSGIEEAQEVKIKGTCLGDLIFIQVTDCSLAN